MCNLRLALARPRTLHHTAKQHELLARNVAQYGAPSSFTSKQLNFKYSEQHSSHRQHSLSANCHSNKIQTMSDAITGKLVTICFSHFVDKARWALELAGLQYVEEGYLPMLHFLAPRRTAGKGSKTSSKFATPALECHDGTDLVSSNQIVAHASERMAIQFELERQQSKSGDDSPRGVSPGLHAAVAGVPLGSRGLFGNSEEDEQDVIALEERFGGVLGQASRRFAYYYLLQDMALLRDMIVLNAPLWQSALVTPFRGTFANLIRKALRIRSDTVGRDLVRMEREFDFVAERLGCKRVAGEEGRGGRGEGGAAEQGNERQAGGSTRPHQASGSSMTAGRASATVGSASSNSDGTVGGEGVRTRSRGTAMGAGATISPSVSVSGADTAAGIARCTTGAVEGKPELQKDVFPKADEWSVRSGEWTAPTRPFIAGAEGKHFTAADLTFAALAAPALLVGPDMGAGAWLPAPEQVPDRMREQVLMLRAHPAGQHALRMFREYRRKLPGGGNGARVRRIHWPLRPVATVAGAGLAALGVLGLAAYGVYRVAKL